MSLSDLHRNRLILKSELADGLPLVNGDRVQLQQVILNLVRNASDAMGTVVDRPRELVIRTEREGLDGVRLSVKDRGLGFTSEAADKLFQAFYTTKNDGMGIEHYSGKTTELISLQQQIAGDIAQKLRSKLSSSDKQQVAKLGTQNPEAYEAYLKGRYYWNKQTASDITTAISYFNQAIAQDPGYALAYSGLAQAYANLPFYGGAPSECYPKGNAAARKALQLDPTLALPHAVLATTEMEYDWDFTGGEAEYKKAFELDPGDPTAHEWYAEDIAFIGGREQEALAEVNRARQLDPLSLDIQESVGFVLIPARQYDQAILECKKVADEDPTYAETHRCLALAYWAKRMYPQVIGELKMYGQLSGDRRESDFASAMEKGFRSAGWKGALIEGIQAKQTQRKTGYVSAYQIAILYADLGDKNQAFRWLDIAYQERDWWMENLKTDFLFDPLRSDPRFDELVRKVGLPQ